MRKGAKGEEREKGEGGRRCEEWRTGEGERGRIEVGKKRGRKGGRERRREGGRKEREGRGRRGGRNEGLRVEGMQLQQVSDLTMSNKLPNHYAKLLLPFDLDGNG